MDPPGNDTLQKHFGAASTSAARKSLGLKDTYHSKGGNCSENTVEETVSAHPETDAVGAAVQGTPRSKLSLPSFANRAVFTDWLVAFKGSPTSNIPVLQQAVDLVSSPEYYHCLIESILANHDWIVDISRNSVIKGQGFLKVVLTTASTLALRLHVYVPNGSFDKAYHDHRWNFASKIVYGTLTQHLGIAKLQTNDSFDYSEQCNVRLFTRDGLKLSWKEAGMATVVHTGVFTLRQGSSYYLRHENIHMVPSQSQVHQDYAGTVTMVMHGPHVKTQAATFWPLDSVLPEYTELQSLEVEDVQQVLRLMLNLPESGKELIKFVENRYYIQA